MGSESDSSEGSFIRSTPAPSRTGTAPGSASCRASSSVSTTPLARCRGDLAFARFPFAHGRFGLRHQRLHRHRSAVRHACRFRPADRGGAQARVQDHPRLRAKTTRRTSTRGFGVARIPHERGLASATACRLPARGEARSSEVDCCRLAGASAAPARRDGLASGPAFAQPSFVRLSSGARCDRLRMAAGRMALPSEATFELSQIGGRFCAERS